MEILYHDDIVILLGLSSGLMVVTRFGQWWIGGHGDVNIDNPSWGDGEFHKQGASNIDSKRVFEMHKKIAENQGIAPGKHRADK